MHVHARSGAAGHGALATCIASYSEPSKLAWIHLYHGHIQCMYWHAAGAGIATMLGAAPCPEGITTFAETTQRAARERKIKSRAAGSPLPSIGVFDQSASSSSIFATSSTCSGQMPAIHVTLASTNDAKWTREMFQELNIQWVQARDQIRRGQSLSGFCVFSHSLHIRALYDLMLPSVSSLYV
jgi:hypothetical protein